MAVTREQALETLESLGVAAIFIHAYLDNELPDHMELYFRPPDEFFLAPDTQEEYTQGRLIPLLDNGSFNLVLFYDPESKTFVRKYVEDPDDPNTQTHYANWNQYLADLMIDIVEGAEEDDDGELEKIAKRIEFERLYDVIAFVDSLSSVPYEEHDERRSGFIRQF